MRAPAEFLADRIAAGDIPSASFVVGNPSGVRSSGALGDAVVAPSRVAATEETIYDLASLTKPLVTSPLAVILAREEGIGLSERAGRFLPEFARLDKREITLEHLLTHTSGLPDWRPLYLGGASIPEYVRLLRDVEPDARPGLRVRYSDIGYIALGRILEIAGGASLDRLARAFILEPAGVSACFLPGRETWPRVAATEEACNYERAKAGAGAASYSGWREGVIRGEVHDQNAFAAGGVAGHAGLFGTARDVYRLAREVQSPESRLYRGNEASLLSTSRTGALMEPRSLGYRINRRTDGGIDPSTAAGGALSVRAFGHNGFTGTSLWIDPAMPAIFVLLTNRVHPKVREELDMNALRREFHRLAAGV